MILKRMGPHIASLGRNHEIIMKSQQNLRLIFFYILVSLKSKMFRNCSLLGEFMWIEM